MNDQIYYLTSQKRKTNHILHLLMCIPTMWDLSLRLGHHHAEQ